MVERSPTPRRACAHLDRRASGGSETGESLAGDRRDPVVAQPALPSGARCDQSGTDGPSCEPAAVLSDAVAGERREHLGSERRTE